MLAPIEKLLGEPNREVKKYIDGPWYLSVFKDVASANVDPIEHYLEHGWKESRDPAPWFSVEWYQKTVLKPLNLGDIDPFEHFLTTGLESGFTPSETAEHDALASAHQRFNAAYYLKQNEDVAAAKTDPWLHFLRHGWREGRDPSPDFDVLSYAEHYLDETMPPRNPLLHYAYVGEKLGHTTSWDGSDSETSVARVQKQPPLETFIASIAPAEAKVDKGSAQAALLNSPLFDPQYYARVTGLTGTKSELIADFLSRAPRTCPNPSAQFSCQFYTRTYAHLVGADVNPLLHYVTIGHRRGFHPSASAARDDVQLIAAHGNASLDLYRQTMRHLPEHPPLLDYVLKGHHHGARLNHDIDDDFIKRIYGSLIGDIGAPLAFFLRHRDAAWMFGSSTHLESIVSKIRACSYFDHAFYRKQAGITGQNIDAATHYAIVGVRERIACHPEFDTDFYLSTYPDVAEVAVIPVLHYAEHGRDEGRIGRSRVVETMRPGGVAYDPSRETVWVFSHEASRTGAPIVALNVVRMLSQKYNIVTWIGLDGPLNEEFEACSINVVEGWSGTDGLREKIKAMTAQAPCKYAIVNSVVCHPVMPALRLERIPVLSLIHEFANYVFPFGATARMALSSDIVVFPAEIVSQATKNELEKIGAGPPPRNLRVRPQGYNSGTSQPAPISAQEVLDYIGVDRDNPRARILFGAGFVQPRKGVDLFLQSARYLLDDPDHDWHFVWVGGNYKPETDMVTSIYIEHQINNTVARQFSFFDEQPSLEPFWEIADVFFLSSRLDPYPNVALDAFARDVPVVCFDGATGIAELEEKYPWAVRVVGFGDVWAAAQACESFARDIVDVRQKFQGEDGRAMMDLLSFDSYIDDLEEFAVTVQRNEADVSELEQALAEMDPVDLRRVMQQVPELLHFNAPTRPDLLRRMLAEFVTPGRLETGLRYDADSKLHYVSETQHPDLVEKIALWSPDYVGITKRGRDQSERHKLYLHISSVESMEILLNAGIGFRDMFDRIQVSVTASSPITLEGLQEIDLSGAEVFERPIFDPIAHLAELAAGDDAGMLTFCDLRMRRGSAFRPKLGKLETQLLKMLGFGAFDRCFQQTDCAAVLAPMQVGERSWTAECTREATGPLCYAPRFAGSYRRDTLHAFFESEWQNIQRESAGFPNDVASSIAAISFADYLIRTPSLSFTVMPLETRFG